MRSLGSDCIADLEGLRTLHILLKILRNSAILAMETHRSVVVASLAPEKRISAQRAAKTKENMLLLI